MAQRYADPPPMGELTTTIHINVAEIPDHARDDLAAATLDLIRGILRQPGGRERLDARIAARHRMEQTSPSDKLP